MTFVLLESPATVSAMFIWSGSSFVLQNTARWASTCLENEVLDTGDMMIHSFLWHVQHATIPCRSQELLPFLSVMYFFPATFLHQLFVHPLPPHLAICFLVYLSVLFPNSYIILFWELYFLPFSVHAQTNVIYLTLLSLL